MANYFISPSGNDGNAGTQAAPWATAAHTFAPGDQVFFRGGNYDIKLIPGQSGTSGNPIVFQAYQGEIPVLRGVSGEEDIIRVTTNWIVVKDLHVQFNPNHTDPPLNSGKYRWAWVYCSGDDNIFDNLNVFKDTLQDPDADITGNYLEIGVQFAGTSTRCTLKNSYIGGINKGVHLTGSSKDIHIVNNIISHTVYSGIVIQGSSLPNVLRGFLIEGNIIEYSWNEDGIQCQAAVAPGPDLYGIIIRYNLFRQNGENDIDLKGVRYCTIEWNVFTETLGSNSGKSANGGNNRNSLSSIAKGANEDALDIIVRNNVWYNSTRPLKQEYDNYKAYNNTMLYNNTDYTGSDSAQLSFSTTSPAFVASLMTYSGSRKKNSFLNSISGGHRAGQLAWGFHTSATDCRLDYNLYFAGVGGGNGLIETFSATAWLLRSFSAWQAYVATKSTIIGKEIHSQMLANLTALKLVTIVDKPMGNHTLFNFRPQTDSPAYKTGAHTAVTVGSGTNSTSMTVDDVTYFRTKYGSSRVGYDPIFVNGQLAYIIAINYNTDVLTLDRAITWTNSTPVYFGYTSTPHIGIDFQDYDFIVIPNTEIQFTDTSTGCTPTSWIWEYQLDGGAWTQFSTTFNPLHMFTTQGVYSVRMTAFCGSAQDTITKLIYILVV